MILKITKVFSTDTKKDGSKMINKWGKPYFRTAVKAEQYGDEWINGFTAFKPEWEGKEVELEISETEFNGKKGKAFAIPKKEDVANKALEQILNKITAIDLKINVLYERLVAPNLPKVQEKVPGTDIDYPDDINPEDIPF